MAAPVADTMLDIDLATDATRAEDLVTLRSTIADRFLLAVRSAELRVTLSNAPADDPKAREFREQARHWKRDTARLSVFERKMMHPAYRRIMGLGRAATRYVLEELRREPDHWFWALEAQTGENPAASATTFQGAADAWLQWGRDQGEI